MKELDRLKKLFWIFLAITAAIAVFTTYFDMTGRQEISVLVKQIDAARECRIRRQVLQGPRYRSSRPKHAIGGYCGYVFTDHGAFHLPQSGAWFLGAGAREEIFDALKENCTFDVVVFGAGMEARPGNPVTNYRAKTIRYVLKENACFGLETQDG